MSPSFRFYGATLLGLSVALSGCQSSRGAAPPPKTAPKPAQVPGAAPKPSPEQPQPEPTPESPSEPAPSPQPTIPLPNIPGLPPGLSIPMPPGAAAPKQGAAPPTAGPKPYAQVIPKTAKTSRGLFVTHLVGNKIFFEIPKATLNTDMMLVGRLITASGSPQNGPFAGDQFLDQPMRWERREHKILMRVPVLGIVADSTRSIARAVNASNTMPIINAFDVMAYGPDSAAVIDVTALFLGGAEFSALGKSARIDPARSFIERVASYPENVVIEATQTGAGQNGGASTVIGHWSLIQLPKQPMMPRLYDSRVGFFNVPQVNFGTSEHRVARRQFINRWRLEKKDPSAALSEPIKPIVYYIDPATPEFLKPFIKAGIEEWQPAFEAAGFKNAILAKDVPTNDPDWSMEDVRNTVIRWLPSTQENAMGPHLNDPRTGEILNGSIRMFHNIMNLQRSWYFTQVGALDPRAQKWPFPDTLMGRLVQYVVAHELGHTLGFPHNHKASSTYPVDSLRSVSWLSKMGHVPSLMDYSRFNYVAQPEDNIPLPLLIPTVGPYDKFATKWGYAPIPGATTPEAERSTLDQWARMQDTVPWYRFGNGAETGFKGNPDFGDAMEAVGDADAVRATTLGIKNLKRIMPMLMTVSVKAGEDYSDLAEIYSRVVGQWATEVGHVVNIIGGVDTYTKYGGQSGAVYTPVSRARQVQAMQFLRDNVFQVPEFLLDERVIRRLEPEGGSSRVLMAQKRILGGLFSTSRINRMVEFQARAKKPSDVYSINEMLTDLRRGVWSELGASSVSIGIDRRNLQRELIDIYGNFLNPPKESQAAPQNIPGLPPGMSMPKAPPAPGELVAGIRVDLMDLQAQVASALSRTANRETRAHLLDVAQRIRNTLDPK